MENERTEKIEFQCSRTSKKPLPLQSPLLDLPIPITELILECLPLPDYIRFGSVCRKWHLIQKQHRIHHSPLSPPMRKSFPWLIRERKNGLLACHSPFEQKYFTFSIPKSKHRLIPPIYNFLPSNLSLGWFFLFYTGHSDQISLFNPVSNFIINLPPLGIKLSNKLKGVLSVSPLSLDCVVLILDYDQAFLYRRKQWMSVDIPNELDCCDYSGTDGVYCDGKFYCIVDGFFVIDFGSTTPTANELIMDCSQLPSEEYDQDQTLVESDGEVLLVDLIYNRSHGSIKVFKAEFSKMMWVRLKNIGDRALFVTSKGSFSVSANDVGCKSNCVYFLDDADNFVKVRGIWTVFDIGTKLWSGGPPCPCTDNENKLDGYLEHWFLPSFEYNV